MSMAIEPGATGRPLWQKILMAVVGSLLGMALLITAILTLTPGGRQMLGLVRGVVEVAQMAKLPAKQPTTELGAWIERWKGGLQANFDRLGEAQKAMPGADLGKIETTQDPVKMAAILKGLDEYGKTVRSVRAANATTLSTAQDEIGGLNLPAAMQAGMRRGIGKAVGPMIDAWDAALAAEDERNTALSAFWSFLSELRPGVGYGIKDGHLNFRTTADLKEFQARADKVTQTEAAANAAVTEAQNRTKAMHQDPVGTVMKLLSSQAK